MYRKSNTLSVFKDRELSPSITKQKKRNNFKNKNKCTIIIRSQTHDIDRRIYHATNRNTRVRMLPTEHGLDRAPEILYKKAPGYHTKLWFRPNELRKFFSFFLCN
jgi:hypothetical protein